MLAVTRQIHVTVRVGSRGLRRRSTGGWIVVGDHEVAAAFDANSPDYGWCRASAPDDLAFGLPPAMRLM